MAVSRAVLAHINDTALVASRQFKAVRFSLEHKQIWELEVI
jgi:hypothetical protein